ncbi:uncharacterized protein LOC106173932 [Lingula anatina]|uniref:Uncharacterized protein LOC106173932 n=1 Tax=Lingula anatina TaxID=7574 RepID=A0A1S3JKR9_LINAN|nr:uncharacterized protein LOC106173932 [Lingula anatina]|eukprot:XP_013410726.1 uncharacterized protein LOC106173932 [Lingula anatina]
MDKYRVIALLLVTFLVVQMLAESEGRRRRERRRFISSSDLEDEERNQGVEKLDDALENTSKLEKLVEMLEDENEENENESRYVNLYEEQNFTRNHVATYNLLRPSCFDTTFNCLLEDLNPLTCAAHGCHLNTTTYNDADNQAHIILDH